MPDDESSSSASELKRTSARALGEAFGGLIQRIRDDTEEIDLNEWYKLVAVMGMQRPETMEVFMTVLAHCENHPGRVFPPGKSKVFRERFIRYAATDMNGVLTEEFRDVIAWMEFKLGALGHRTSRRATTWRDAFR